MTPLRASAARPTRRTGDASCASPPSWPADTPSGGSSTSAASGMAGPYLTGASASAITARPRSGQWPVARDLVVRGVEVDLGLRQAAEASVAPADLDVALDGALAAGGAIV